MQVAIRLGWETGVHAVGEFAGAVVFIDDVADEVGGGGEIGLVHRIGSFIF
jgi:hypothetical protein